MMDKFYKQVRDFSLGESFIFCGKRYYIFGNTVRDNQEWVIAWVEGRYGTRKLEYFHPEMWVHVWQH